MRSYRFARALRTLMLGAVVPLLLNAGATLPHAPEKFVHPGLFYSSSDLAFMRRKIAAQAEPWYSAWQQFKSGRQSARWTPHAIADWQVDRNPYMSGDAVEAHRQALEWALTGNPANAAKAIEILNAWSATLETITGSRSQEKVVCGWNGYHLANAAELLVHASPDGKNSGWAPADVQRFKKMLGIPYRVIEDFQPRFNGNWDASMMNTMISMAVFLDDRAMFDRAVQHYLVGEKPNGGLSNYIYPSGQCQESGRDQAHVQMGLGNFVALCEVAWKQGIDLYGAENNRLLTGLEYTAKYMLGNEVEYVSPYSTAISPDRRGVFLPIWETAYQHYVYRRGMAMPFTKQVIFGGDVMVVGRNHGAAGPYRPESATPNAGVCWGTLTMFKGMGLNSQEHKPVI